MSVVWIDGQVAMAGDMLLAALLDAGASVDAVRDGLGRLQMPGWTLATEEVRRGAFRATRVVVKVSGEVADARFVPVADVAEVPRRSLIARRKTSAPLEARDHAHDHDHGHAHDHGHGGAAGRSHGPHRPWRDVRALIEGANLPDRVRARAIAVYSRLAEAEASLHMMPVDDVELHEVGATDAIVDIVGVCLALEDLKADAVICTALPLSTGMVNAAHGAIPLPAPATLEVLRGWPVTPGAVPGEWVTPTGAALVAALATAGGPPPMTVRAVGHGAGTRDPQAFANLVRVVVGAPVAGAAGDAVELVCNVDDMPGQHVAAAMERALAEGALDAWAVPATMKKGRPAVILHVLAPPSEADRLADLLLLHTTTLGVRRHAVQRSVLDRWFESVDTVFGPIRVKVGGKGGVAWHAHPEYDDVAKAALAAGVPLAEVHAAALAAWNR